MQMLEVDGPILTRKLIKNLKETVLFSTIFSVKKRLNIFSIIALKPNRAILARRRRTGKSSQRLLSKVHVEHVIFISNVL